jgi:predicted patatin/cPLA2 family phospholipase
VAQAEREGRCLVIRPADKIAIGHISHDAKQMRLVYEQGRAVGEKYLDSISDFYGL